MRSRALQLVVLGCLVGLAGCTGGLPGGGDDPTLDDVSYPEGVTDNGTNVTALAETHSDALENRSFALAVETTVNGSATNQSVAMDVAVGLDRDEGYANTTTGDRRMATYLASETRYTRIGTEEGPQYRATERTPTALQFVPASFSGANYLGRFLGVADLAPTGVRVVDGTTLVVREADGSNATAASPANLTDYDATVPVDERGVVHSVTAAAAGSNGGETARTRFSMNVSDVGETTVEEPPWLDEARNRTGG